MVIGLESITSSPMYFLGKTNDHRGDSYELSKSEFIFPRAIERGVSKTEEITE